MLYNRKKGVFTKINVNVHRAVHIGIGVVHNAHSTGSPAVSTCPHEMPLHDPAG